MGTLMSGEEDKRAYILGIHMSGPLALHNKQPSLGFPVHVLLRSTIRDHLSVSPREGLMTDC